MDHFFQATDWIGTTTECARRTHRFIIVRNGRKKTIAKKEVHGKILDLGQATAAVTVVRTSGAPGTQKAAVNILLATNQICGEEL